MRKEIKYIGFYDLHDSEIKRVSSMAAINKMDYISESIIKAGFDVNIVSPSWSSNNDITYNQKEKTVQINEHKKVTFCPTYSTKNKLTGYLKIIFTLSWLFFWLLKNAKRDEKIIVYHVQWLSLPIRLAKFFIGFHLVLEVEEFYGKIWKNKSILHKWEQELIKSADSYIAVSDLLSDILGDKVRVVVYGNYSVPISIDGDFFLDNNKINVVYAGSIDDTKGGAFNAVRCAELLPEKYIVHIIGSGSNKLIEELNKMVDLVNSKHQRIACVYHGVKIGEEFNEFLFSCQIALNPQKEGNYMNTAFPSKVISYLSHNLRVVSTVINSIVKSKLSHLVTFANDDKPESIVDQILAIDLYAPFNSKDYIKELDENFVLEMKSLFGYKER